MNNGITHIAGIEGQLNGATVSWAWEWSGTEGTAPHVLPMGEWAIVTTDDINGLGVVAPGHGTITLTPTLSCGTAEALTLEPITMSIGYEFVDSGECCAGKIDPSECPPSGGGGGGGECGFSYFVAATQTVGVGSDCAVKVYDASFELIHTIELADTWVHHVAVSPGGEYIALALYAYSSANILRVYRTDDWSLVTEAQAMGKGVVSCAEFSPDGAYLAVGSSNYYPWTVFDTATWSSVHTGSYAVNALAWANGKLGVLAADDSVRVLTVDSWTESLVIDSGDVVGLIGGEEYINGVANLHRISWSPDGRYLSCGAVWSNSEMPDGAIYPVLWDSIAASPVLIGPIGPLDDSYAMTFSPRTGDLAIAGQQYGCGDLSYAVVSVPSGTVIHSAQTIQAWDASWSRGGEYLAFGNGKGCASGPDVLHADDWSGVGTYSETLQVTSVAFG